MEKAQRADDERTLESADLVLRPIVQAVLYRMFE